MTDRELLIAMHGGDPHAAAELWSRLGPRLVAYVRAALGPGRGEDAEDAVQAAFARVLELSHAQLRGIADPAAYIARAARRLSLNTVREASRRKRRETLRPTPPAAAAEPAGPLSDDAALLSRAVAALHPDDRELLLLRHVACLTFDQMALVLEVSRDTLASRHRAAIGRLRCVLECGAAPLSDAVAPRARGGAGLALGAAAADRRDHIGASDVA